MPVYSVIISVLFVGTNSRNTMKLLLRRTLVLQEYYSANTKHLNTDLDDG